MYVCIGQQVKDNNLGATAKYNFKHASNISLLEMFLLGAFLSVLAHTLFFSSIREEIGGGREGVGGSVGSG